MSDITQAYRLTESLLHLAGWWTSFDQAMKEADETDWSQIEPRTVEELIAELRLEPSASHEPAEQPRSVTRPSTESGSAARQASDQGDN